MNPCPQCGCPDHWLTSSGRLRCAVCPCVWRPGGRLRSDRNKRRSAARRNAKGAST